VTDDLGQRFEAINIRLENLQVRVDHLSARVTENLTLLTARFEVHRSEIIVRLDRLNGRISELERWRSYTLGAIAVLTTLFGVLIAWGVARF
jgi:uncharacterized protein HemX